MTYTATESDRYRERRTETEQPGEKDRQTERMRKGGERER